MSVLRLAEIIKALPAPPAMHHSIRASNACYDTRFLSAAALSCSNKRAFLSSPPP